VFQLRSSWGELGLVKIRVAARDFLQQRILTDWYSKDLKALHILKGPQILIEESPIFLVVRVGAVILGVSFQE